MSISLLLEMAVSADPDRLAVVDGDVRMTTSELSAVADGGAALIDKRGARHVAYVGLGGALLPALLFGSARAGRAFTPLNYRLSPQVLVELVARLDNPLLVVDDEYRDAVSAFGGPVVTSGEVLAAAGLEAPEVTVPAAEDVGVVLFTSGTTSRPKAVQLTHHNLTSYITGTVDFCSAAPDDAALVCVPPYHIAGVGAALSNLYAGRRVVYQSRFDAAEWIRLVNDEGVTTATVVPTMLERIIGTLESQPVDVPTLRNLAYGGSKVAMPLVRKALRLLPAVGFVNAYGLTETSSTIAVLTPDDHRTAIESAEPSVAGRLGSVGRAVPGVELQIRDDNGVILGPNESGELYVRGDQVAGRYAEIGSVLDSDGWFPTRDVARLDEDGYLYISGRSDDTIIRGGENIAPAEIEDILVEHPDVDEVAVVGVEDSQWGQLIVAVVVPAPGSEPDAERLREYARGLLRGSRTPDRVVFREELPTTDTGKVLRRKILDDLAGASH